MLTFFKDFSLLDGRSIGFTSNNFSERSNVPKRGEVIYILYLVFCRTAYIESLTKKYIIIAPPT
jgi:hypothetical protein